MKTDKNSRQERILSLIRENEISTQEDLTAKVNQSGFEATQATISRDIKELGIIKITLPNKATKYCVSDRTGDTAPGRLLAVFTNSIISVSQAMNMIVIKTLPGMASAAASALDSMHLEECVGTIAGDDTIFAACPGIEEAKALLITINDMTEKG